MYSPPSAKHLSIEEYLAFEENSKEKHEYYGGELFAMAGGTIEHNQIVRNILTAIDNFLRDKACQVFPSDLKVFIEKDNLFTYPDISIVCGALEKWESRNDIITNPII